MIEPKEFAKYLGTMLGRTVELDALVQLTSGQQARAASWLAERGLSVQELRGRLSGPFRPTSFALVGDAIPAQSSVQALPSPVADFNDESLRVGIDIQRVDELLPKGVGYDLKSSSEVTSMFTLREISYAQSRPAPLDTLCGLFAAKEALRKCDSLLFTLPLKELEILPNAAGQPQFRGFSLSISHSGGYAIAVAARLSTPISASKGEPATIPRQVQLPTPSATQHAKRELMVNWPLRAVLALAVLASGILIGRLLAGT